MKKFILIALLLTGSLCAQAPTRHCKKEVIVLDAGHGGEDRGTKSLSKPILIEKRLTLFTTILLRSALEGLGYQTLMTRWKDETISLDDRVIFSNNVHPHCFVSIHYNSAPSLEANGIEVFLYRDKGNPKRTQNSEKLAELVLKNVLNWSGAESRGVKNGNFRVIKDTEDPAILVELGFLSNKEEAKKISEPLYAKQLAMGVAHGIDEYLTSRRTQKRSSP